MFILMDSSKDVAPDIFEKQKELVKAFVRSFAFSPKGPHGNVLIYAQFAYIVTDLSKSVRAIYNRIDSATLLGKPRRVDTALQQTAALLSRSKHNGRKIVVLLIAGRHAPGTGSLAEAIKPLVRLRAQIFVVAIGQQLRKKDTRPIVDRPQDVFSIKEPASLLSSTGAIAKAIHDKPGIIRIKTTDT